MKMIRAIVRPEKVEEIVNSLEKEGFNALTKINVFGRGKQKGIQIGQTRYDELPKVLHPRSVKSPGVVCILHSGKISSVESLTYVCFFRSGIDLSQFKSVSGIKLPPLQSLQFLFL